MARGVDRRREPRVELRGVGMIDFGSRVLPCRLLDISRTGLALVTTVGPPAGIVRVRFRLGSRDAAWTEVDARVVRATDWDVAGERKIWGMKLQPMDLGTRTRLRGFVAYATRP
ncbi:PilZ domain-containing protein [Pseudenhygromyxa sp. WMMC2535]|uniref:PilZ domain-containing protein n=1 Tax=Pseudenhygromyxa sp. WMMC2535 TaxID=2712867 RepID=UPI00155664E1|nr:PilZ domain-containing protein [Pseudenhygromyxa sp. WMMC2535]NVB39783.1 PilZ domain-containing protein [Pseudenhygromyxa sp. WMMC2535]